MNLSKATKRIAVVALAAALALIPVRGLLSAGVFTSFAGNGYAEEFDLSDGDILVDLDGWRQPATGLGLSDVNERIFITGGNGVNSIEIADDIQPIFDVGNNFHAGRLNINQDAKPRLTLGMSSIIDTLYLHEDSISQWYLEGDATIHKVEGNNSSISLETAGEGYTLEIGDADHELGIFATVTNNLRFQSGTDMPFRFSKTGAADLFLTGMDTINAVVHEGRLVFNNSLNDPIDGDAEIKSGAALIFSSDANLTFAGKLSGDGDLIIAGGHTLALTNQNDFTGETYIEQGTLQLGDQSNSAFLGGNITIGASSLLLYNHYGNEPFTVGGHISGEGSLRKEGDGTVVLTNDNNYSGATIVSDGMLQLGNNTPQGSVPLENVSVLPGAMLGFHHSEDRDLDLALNWGGALVKYGDNMLSLMRESTVGRLFLVSGVLAVDEKLHTDSADIYGGILNLYLDSDDGIPLEITGPLTITGTPILQIDGMNHVNYRSVRNVIKAGSIDREFYSYRVQTPEEDYLTVTVPKTDRTISVSKDLRWFAQPINADGVFTISNSETFTLDESISDRAGENSSGWDGKTLTKKGSGELRLKHANLHTGGIVVKEGSVAVDNLLSLGSGPIHVEKDASLRFDTTGKTSNTFTGSGSVRLSKEGTLTLYGEHSNTGFFSVDAGGLEFSGWKGGIFVDFHSSLRPLNAKATVGDILNLRGELYLDDNYPLYVGAAVLDPRSMIRVDATGLEDGQYALIQAMDGKIDMDKVTLEVTGIAGDRSRALLLNNNRNLLYLVLGEQPENPEPTAITFDNNGTLTGYVLAASGDVVGKADWPLPTREGYTFGGWFTEREGNGIEYTATTPIHQSITLYAHWIAENEGPEGPENPDIPSLPENPEIPKDPQEPETPKDPEEPGDGTDLPKPELPEVTAPPRPGWKPNQYAAAPVSEYTGSSSSGSSSSGSKSKQDTDRPKTQDNTATGEQSASGDAAPLYWIDTAEMSILYKSALNAGQNYIHANRTSSSAIRKAALAMLVGVRYEYDTVENGVVKVRVYINEPTSATKDINLSGAVSGAEVDKIKAKFNLWFQNKIAVLCLEQQGDFGMTLQIAAKLDLSGMDTKQLHLYSYDRTTNSYKAIQEAEYWIDANGYLRFTTKVGGDIIVSEGPLVRQ